MSIKINYLEKLDNKPFENLVLFVDENFNIKDIKKYISNSEFLYIADLLKNSDLKKDLHLFPHFHAAMLKNEFCQMSCF